VKLVRGIWVSNFPSRERLFRELNKVGVDPKEEDIIRGIRDTWSWGTRLPADDPRVARIEATFPIPRDGIGLLISCQAEYDQSEIDAAELLKISFSVRSREELAPYMGAKFDYSTACPACGSGGTLLPGSGFPARALPAKRTCAVTSLTVLLVTGDLLQDLRQFPNSEQWLVQLADNKKRHPLPWHAVWSRTTLPPAFTRSKGFALQPDDPRFACSICDRNRWATSFEQPYEYVYSREEVRKACGDAIPEAHTVPDVASTWERDGCGSPIDGSATVWRVPTPYTFVSQRVYRILRKHMKKHLYGDPATLVD